GSSHTKAAGSSCDHPSSESSYPILRSIESVKRIFVLLSVLASCLAVFLVVASLTTSRAHTVTDEVALRLLPVPINVTGTTIRGVSNDGKRIVFDSLNDYNGNNPTRTTEIYVYDVDSRSI